ncbi:hypothetical protein WJX75_002659 [Coccomyxa subellipsoidea]|uniref:PIN domain-like protein n=1 Tax=Coccomyxa subellipsoidea TaxID=248742 RepID=A0ABR2YBZ9_9CHLO
MLKGLAGAYPAPQQGFVGISLFLLELPKGESRSLKGLQRLTITCAKKTAKKCAPKGDPSQNEGQAAAPVPPRIINTSQLSLRQQKRFIEEKKKLEQAPQKQKALPARKWRKPKVEADERAAEEELKRQAARAVKAEQERRRKVRRALVDMLLRTVVDKHPPVLLVDGYNVLLKRALLEAEQYMEAQTLADARERLVNDTRDYALVTGCRAVVVFDAFNNPESLATSREMVAGVEVVYPKGSDADMYIMAEAKLARAEGAPRVVVVSNDREISAALDYSNAMGWMQAEMYLQEMKRVGREADRVQREAEEDQMVELLRQGGTIAQGALKDRATLNSLTALRRKLENGRGGRKQLFRLERCILKDIGIAARCVATSVWCWMWMLGEE